MLAPHRGGGEEVHGSMDGNGIPDLTSDEEQFLQRFGERVMSRARGPHPVWTLARAVGRWQRLVQDVEHGYGAVGGVDDYCYDLTGRDEIQQLLDAVPADLRLKIATVVDPLDERFLRATRLDEDDVLGQFYRHGAGWWWRRLPLIINGALVPHLSQ
jgi:hypothetical protein